MKVLVCFSLVMLSLLLFVRCKSSEEVVKFKPYKFKDYVTKEIEVYEARECLYPLLDSIIMKTKECPMYQGLKIKMAFIYGVWSDSITQFGISAVYLSKYINHAKWTDAVFYYGGYKNICACIYNPELSILITPITFPIISQLSTIIGSM